MSRFRGRFATVEVGERITTTDYAKFAGELPGIDKATRKLGEPQTPASLAAVTEFVLEGLHLGKRLNKTPLDNRLSTGADPWCGEPG